MNDGECGGWDAVIPAGSKKVPKGKRIFEFTDNRYHEGEKIIHYLINNFILVLCLQINIQKIMFSVLLWNTDAYGDWEVEKQIKKEIQ